MKNPYHIIKNILFKTPLLLGVLFFLSSCENDIQQVNELTAREDSAIVSADNVEIKYSLSGNIKFLLNTPYLERFIEPNDKSYIEFPKGVHMVFYNETGEVTSTLRANYSIYYEDEGRWIAQYDVEAVNEKGEKLNTEYLVWSQKEGTITSDQHVKVTASDGIYYGDGFESDQTFTTWEILKPRGIINIDAEGSQ